MHALAPEAPALQAESDPDHLPFHAGAISQVDTFEYKPRLQREGGSPPRRRNPTASNFAFRRYGESGAWFSDLCLTWPRMPTSSAGCAGLHRHAGPPAGSRSVAHGQRHAALTRPSMGAWLLYGLGTENQDLPGYVTINPPPNFGGAVNYGTRVPPRTFSGHAHQSSGIPPKSEASNRIPAQQLRQLELTQSMNRSFATARARVTKSMESFNPTSWRSGCKERFPSCSTSRASLKPSLTPRREARPGRHLRAPARDGPAPLRGRRPLRRDLPARLGSPQQPSQGYYWTRCASVDQPTAALLADLDQRRLLDETLVLFGSDSAASPLLRGRMAATTTSRATQCGLPVPV